MYDVYSEQIIIIESSNNSEKEIHYPQKETILGEKKNETKEIKTLIKNNKI